MGSNRPNPHKEVIIEWYQRGRRVDKIAEFFGLSESAIYSILRRARIPLRKPHRYGYVVDDTPPPPEENKRGTYLWDRWQMTAQQQGETDDDR